MDNIDDLYKKVEKIKLIIRQYEGVIQTTHKKKVLEESKQEISKLNEQLKNLLTDTSLENESSLKNNEQQNLAAFKEKSNESFKIQIIDKFPIKSICTDHEINYGNAIIRIWIIHFFPFLFNQQIPIEPTRRTLRDSLHFQIEGLKREQKNLIYTLDSLKEAEHNKDLQEKIKISYIQFKCRWLFSIRYLFQKKHIFWNKYLIEKIEFEREYNIKDSCLTKKVQILSQFETNYLREKDLHNILNETVVFTKEAYLTIFSPPKK